MSLFVFTDISVSESSVSLLSSLPQAPLSQRVYSQQSDDIHLKNSPLVCLTRRRPRHVSLALLRSSHPTQSHLNLNLNVNPLLPCARRARDRARHQLTLPPTTIG